MDTLPAFFFVVGVNRVTAAATAGVVGVGVGYWSVAKWEVLGDGGIRRGMQKKKPLLWSPPTTPFLLLLLSSSLLQRVSFTTTTRFGILLDTLLFFRHFFFFFPFCGSLFGIVYATSFQASGDGR